MKFRSTGLSLSQHSSKILKILRYICFRFADLLLAVAVSMHEDIVFEKVI